MILGASVIRSIAAKIISFEPYMKPQLLEPWRNLDLTSVSRKLSSQRITKNIELFTNGKNSDPAHHKNSPPREEMAQAMEKTEGARNLVVIFRWLMSKPHHIMKFTNLYIEQGFDVVTVSLTPLQLLRPVTGSRVVASDLLLFLTESEYYRKIVLHGFSVGGYLWGEALTIMEDDQERYKFVDRIVGQIWDSIADVTEVPVGTPRAMFPKNVWLQNLMQKCLEYHMHIFYDQSTRYYINAREAFHRTTVRAPALLFISEADPVANVKSHLKIRDCFESIGIPTHMKVFKSSPHVGNFHMYPKEYLKELYIFLDKLNLLQNQEKLRARL